MFTAKHQSKLAQFLKRKPTSDGGGSTPAKVRKNVGTNSMTSVPKSTGHGKQTTDNDSKSHKSYEVIPEKRRKNAKKSVGQISLKSKSETLTEESKNRLAFSLFRSINEYLYSNSSDDVLNYMNEDTFNSYHSAYSILASKWPVKPIDVIIEWMDKIYANQGKGQTFADMGCGDKPMIAEHFVNAKVHSFDLYSSDGRITKSCITSVPIEDNSCHCVIYSLSLMNTNVRDVMKEAARILKNSGHLIIAEVASRFQPQKMVGDKSDQEKLDGGKSDVKATNCDTVHSFGRKLQKHFNLKKKRLEYLKPNDYFVIMDFVKVKGKLINKSDDEEETTKKKTKKIITKIPEIKLNPCLYKPR